MDSASPTDIVTKLGDGNRLMSQLVQTVADRSNTWNITGTIPISQGGTGATTAPDARTNLGLVIGTDVQAYLPILNTAGIGVRAIAFIIDGGGATPSTGVQGDLSIPFACTINSVTMLADQSGSIVVDILKSAYAAYPPVSSICGAAPPTISTATKSTDTTLTGWTTSIAAGDCLRFSVSSVTSITRVTLTLKVTIT